MDFGGEFLAAGRQKSIEGVDKGKEPVSGDAGAEDCKMVFSGVLGEGACADDLGVGQVVKEI